MEETKSVGVESTAYESVSSLGTIVEDGLALAAGPRKIENGDEKTFVVMGSVEEGYERKGPGKGCASP
jgi:hypothetical protein